MLVLTRRKGERVTMLTQGPNNQPIEIVVQVNETRSGQVRLAIQAPQCVRILSNREEDKECLTAK